MAGAEMAAAEAFLQSRLNGNPTLVTAIPGGFHSERQPQSLLNPYVLYYQQGTPPDMLGEHGVRILSKPLYIIAVVDKTRSFSTLVHAYRLLDETLHMAPPQAVIIDGENYTIQSCLRERPYSLVEPFLDLQWRRLGGYYRIQVSPY